MAPYNLDEFSLVEFRVFQCSNKLEPFNNPQNIFQSIHKTMTKKYTYLGYRNAFTEIANLLQERHEDCKYEAEGKV